MRTHCSAPAGQPLSRAAAPEPLNATLDAEGYLLRNGSRIGPDGLPMPLDEVLPSDHLVTPERRPRLLPTRSPIGPRGVFANPDGVYVGEDGRPYDREGNPIGPPGTAVGADGFIAAPDGTRYMPNGEQYPAEGTLPEGVTVGPDGVPRNADGTPVGARGTVALADGSIVNEAGTPIAQEATANAATTTAEREGDSSLGAGPITAIVLAVVVVCLLAALCAYFIWRSNRHRRSPHAAAGATGTVSARGGGARAGAGDVRLQPHSAPVDTPPTPAQPCPVCRLAMSRSR
jgi:hypothetical protein